MVILSIIVALLPVILIGLFIYKNDKIKEPKGLLFKLFFSGVASCFPALILELIVGNLFPSEESMNFIQMFLYAVIGIALIEEACKWIFVYKISYNHDEFDSLYDMVVYSSFVSLGFACFENMLYVLSTNLLTGIVRAISAVPGHVCYAIFMGTYLSLAKINQKRGNKKISNKYKLFSLIIPVMVHAIYDYCLFLDNVLFIFIFIMFVITIFIICFRKLKELATNNIKFKYKNNYCTRCGLEVSSKYCTRCGNLNE